MAKAQPKTPRKQQDRVLRSKALQLYDKHQDAEVVAKIVGVRTMTVAAWVAHRTMGTYDSE